MEDFFQVQHLNVSDFRFLEIDYTFQFAEHLTLWKVVNKTRKENENVWTLVPAALRAYGTKHFINETEVVKEGSKA